MPKPINNPIDSHVGARLRVQRMSIGMSQDALAKALDVTFQQVQKYEKGSNRIAASRLYETAELLGVEIGFFYEGMAAKGERPAVRPRGDKSAGNAFAMDFVTSSEGFALNRAFANIQSKHKRALVMALIQGLAKVSEIED